MAGRVPNGVRDELMTLFRERICDKMGITPLLHQRRWWCAGDGVELQEHIEDPINGVPVMLPDGSVIRCATLPRMRGGVQTRARVIADLAAFKSGKSFSSALWTCGIAAVPGGKVSLIGIEYDAVAPEFDYICEFLLSSRGMGIKAVSLQNRPRDGKMWLELPGGVTIDARSWERKESLKGKEADIYLFAEAYQLPGLECYTAIKQNLVARSGYAVFPTTPDRPWLKDLHDRGHDNPDFPDWECICCVPRSENHYTYSAKEEKEDRSLLTTEKFNIAHYGKLGDFVGKVFNYSRGQVIFTPSSHPDLFQAGEFKLPNGWEIVGGADTGTFTSALLVAFDPNGLAYVIEEFPNYRYVAGKIERNEAESIPSWARRVTDITTRYKARANFWADANTQFKPELRNYHVHLLSETTPVEARTEITREYFEHGRIFLAPWLSILPFELENAAWPEEASSAGKFARVKDRDHTLDCLEHILAKRPYGRIPASSILKGGWAAGEGLKRRSSTHNVHLGRL